MDSQLGLFYKQLQTASNVLQLEKLICSIDVELKEVDAQTKRYVDEFTSALNSNLNSVELNRLNLATALNSNSKPLVTKINNANDLSYGITKKIRLLDQEKYNINQCCQYVQNVTLLKTEILNCNLFLENKNWRNASQSINNILTRLPPELLENDAFVSFVVPTSDLPELPKTTINAWIEQLSSFFKEEFEKASEAKDVSKLTDYFLLFPLLLKSDVGLNCYSKFIVNLINEQSRNLLTNISRDSKLKTGFHSLTLLKVFEIISTIINQHSSLIVENYDSKSMLQVMMRIQKECDIQCGLIFDTFWDSKNLVGTIQKVSKYEFPILIRLMLDAEEDETVNYVEEISIIDINDLCYELASMLKNWKMYCNFLKIKWDNYSGLVNSNETPAPVTNSSFISKIRDKIVPTYDELSTFQLRRSIEKSYDMEELPDLSHYLLLKETSNAPITSVVDDVILVLNNVLTRTLETGDEFIIKNMVTNSKRILEIDLIQLLAKRLMMNHPRANTVLTLPTAQNVRNSNEFSRDQSLSPRAGTPSNNYGSLFMRGATSAITNAINFSKDDDLRRLETFIIYLNSVESLKNYLGKLVENLKSRLVSDKLFMHYDEGNTNVYDNSVTSRLANILNSVSENLQAKCSTIINDNLSLLYQQVFNFKINKLVNDFFYRPDDYISTNFASNDELLKFINQFRSLYQPYEKTLLPALFLRLMSIVTAKLSSFLERKIMGMRFSDVGSISLEKNLSFIIGDVSKIDYKLREKFLRVTQIIMVLSLDDDEDDQLFDDDEEGDGENLGIKWVLTPNERQRARNLRIDIAK